MKYRIAAGALLIAVLTALALVTLDDRPRTGPATAAQQPGSDDAAMKSLNIN